MLILFAYFVCCYKYNIHILINVAKGCLNAAITYLISDKKLYDVLE